MYTTVAAGLHRALAPKRVDPSVGPSAPMPAHDQDVEARFFLRLAQALHVFGMGVHRVEDALQKVADSLHITGSFLATPTFVVFTIGEVENARTHLARVGHQELDLKRLTRLHRLVAAVVRGEIGLEEASDQLEKITRPRPPWGALATAVAHAVTAAGAAVVLEGGSPEVIAATILGALVGFVVSASENRESLLSIVPLMAGVLASFGAHAAAAVVHPMVPYIPLLAAIITLLPGMTLTIAINELAREHTVSGGARLTGVMMTLLQLGFGVALGQETALRVVGEPSVIDPGTLGTSWVTGAAALIVLAFAVRNHARMKDLPLLLLTAGLGLVVSRLGTAALGAELGVASAAWIIGVTSNLVSRWANIPMLTTILPAILLMVPGSLGFRSMSALIQQDVVVGMQGVFSMLLVAFSLVTGLLLANLTSRPTDLF